MDHHTDVKVTWNDGGHQTGEEENDRVSQSSTRGGQEVCDVREKKERPGGRVSWHQLYRSCGFEGGSRKNIWGQLIGNEEGTSFPVRLCGTWSMKEWHLGGLREQPQEPQFHPRLDLKTDQHLQYNCAPFRPCTLFYSVHRSLLSLWLLAQGSAPSRCSGTFVD